MRIAGIRYINALPLQYGLEKNSDVELSLDTPSACYRKLIEGTVDVALIPIIGTQMNSSIRAVKGLGIAATSRTESVYVFSNKPLDKIETVLVDAGSLTSAVLLKIVLKEKFRNLPQVEKASGINIHEALRRYDAALIIGDDAILTEKTDYDHYDLCTEWYSLTGFPFVFAFWASNRALSSVETEWLHQSYLEASRNWQDVYRKASDMLPVDLNFLKRYYNENLHFHLARQDYEGLLRFLTLAAELQFIEKVRKDIWL